MKLRQAEHRHHVSVLALSAWIRYLHQGRELIHLLPWDYEPAAWRAFNFELGQLRAAYCYGVAVPFTADAVWVRSQNGSYTICDTISEIQPLLTKRLCNGLFAYKGRVFVPSQSSVFIYYYLSLHSQKLVLILPGSLSLSCRLPIQSPPTLKALRHYAELHVFRRVSLLCRERHSSWLLQQR